MTTAAVTPEPLAARPVPTPRTVLAVASIGIFIAFVDATIVNIAFPSIEKSFPDSPQATVSWVLSGYNVVLAAFLVAGGRLADLLGRRRVFSASLGLFTLASVLCAAAPTLGVLIGARVLQAVGGAILIPSSLGLVLAGFPEERRGHAVALWTAVGAAAAGVGPTLGGLLVSAADWRLVFIANVPVGVLGIVLASRTLVESRAPGRRRVPDLPGSVVFAVATALLLVGIVQGRDWGWGSVRIVGAFVLAAAGLAVFARRCATHRDPLIDPALVRRRSVAVANAMTVLAGTGFFGYTLVNVLFLTGIWRYSVLQAGLALTPGPFVAVALAGVGSRVAERFGPRAVVVPGGLIWGGATMWMVTQLGTTPDFLGEWLPGIVLLGVGAGLTMPVLGSTSVAAAGDRSFALASALNSVARQVGGALGIALVVTIIGTPSPAEAADAFDHAWTFAAIALACSGAGFLLLGRLPAAEAQDVGPLPSLGEAARAVIGRAPARPAPGPGRISAPAADHEVPDTIAPPRETVADFLAGVPMLAGLDPALRERIAASARDVRLEAGAWLFRAGDDGDAMYVVRAGRLEVVRDEDGRERVLREVGRGDAVGELALMTHEPRSASVRAARATDLIAIGRDTFEELMDGSPALARGIAEVLAGQLRRSRGAVDAVRPLPTTIAVVSMDRDAPTADFADALAKDLGRHDRVALLADEEGAGSPEDPPLARYGPRLDRAEQHADRVVLAGGDATAPDPWTAFCLQQADRLLVLTSGGADAPVPEGRPELRGCDLVACGVAPGSQALAAAARALEPLATHALPAPRDADAVARIARRLTGRSLGIALSGGGARALSHIGVLEELMAAGVRIDRVAGVSMGAFVGALFAAGHSPEEIDARAYLELVRRRPLGDVTVPRHGLVRGERWIAMLERTFGTVCIEELPLGFFCAAADLRASELVVSRHGLLVDAVATSMSLPIIGAPYVSGRRLITDGSLIDNLPVEQMAWLNEGPLIAVDVRATVDRPARPRPAAPQPETDGEDGARAAHAARNGDDRPAPGRPGAINRLRRRLAEDGQRPTPPLIGETLGRVLLLASSNTAAAARRHAQLVIEPRTPGIGLLEFHQLDAAREAGRAAARQALEAAQDALAL